MAGKVKIDRFEMIIGDNPRRAIKNAIKSLEDLEEKSGASLGIVGVSGLIDYSAHMGYITSWEAEQYQRQCN